MGIQLQRSGLKGDALRMVAAASSRVPCYGRSGIRILPTVDVAPLGRRVDEVARDRRELLDTAIQAANRTT